MSEVVNIPQLRFPEFNGEWEEKALGVVATITTGSTPSTSNNEYYDGDVAFVSPADIQGNRIVRSTKTTITELGLSVVREIKKRSTLFVCIGSTIGKVSQAGVNCATNQQINALTAKNSFDNDFIYSLLEFKAPRIKLLAGVQAVPQINKSEFSRFKFTFPLLPEQQKIAAFLTAVDNKIEQLSKKQALLGEYKKGLMQQIFSQAIRFKADDGSEFPDWEDNTIDKALHSYKLGGNYSNSEAVTDYPLIKMGNLDRGNIKLNKLQYINTEENIDDSDKINYGDLFFNTRNTLDLVGKVAIWRDELPCAYYNSNLMKMEFSDNFFMNYRFNSFDGIKALRRVATGTTSVAAIYTKDLLKIKFSLPTLSEQQKIANFLSSIDTKIEQAGKQLDESKQFKKALLQQMFV